MTVMPQARVFFRLYVSLSLSLPALSVNRPQGITARSAVDLEHSFHPLHLRTIPRVFSFSAFTGISVVDYLKGTTEMRKVLSTSSALALSVLPLSMWAQRETRAFS